MHKPGPPSVPSNTCALLPHPTHSSLSTHKRTPTSAGRLAASVRGRHVGERPGAPLAASLAQPRADVAHQHIHGVGAAAAVVAPAGEQRGLSGAGHLLRHLKGAAAGLPRTVAPGRGRRDPGHEHQRHHRGDLCHLRLAPAELHQPDPPLLRHRARARVPVRPACHPAAADALRVVVHNRHGEISGLLSLHDSLSPPKETLLTVYEPLTPHSPAARCPPVHPHPTARPHQCPRFPPDSSPSPCGPSPSCCRTATPGGSSRSP
jgi:hypothetical protein